MLVIDGTAWNAQQWMSARSVMCLVVRLAGMLEFVALDATAKYVTTALRMKDDAADVKWSFAVNANLMNSFAALAVGVAIARIATRLGNNAYVVKPAALSATRVEMQIKFTFAVCSWQRSVAT